MQTFHKKENVHVDISKTHLLHQGRKGHLYVRRRTRFCGMPHWAFHHTRISSQSHPGWQFQWLLTQFAEEFYYPLSSVLYIQLSAWYFLCNTLKAPQNRSKLMIFSLFPKPDSWVLYFPWCKAKTWLLTSATFLISPPNPVLLYFLNSFLICSFVSFLPQPYSSFHHLSLSN